MLPSSLRQSMAFTIAFHLFVSSSVHASIGLRQQTPRLLASQGCPPASECNFNVLAIGDSLTRGAIPSKNSAHPYSIKLEQLLKQKFSQRAVARVTTAGYDYMGVFQKAKAPNGSTLDVTFVPFLKQQLQQAAAQGTKYQWVIVMAGINDLGAGNRTAASIMPKLAEAYQAAMATGANVIAILPFPNRFVTRDSKNEQQRRALISLMRRYTANQPVAADCGQPRVYLQQLPADWFDFWSMPEARIGTMQDDKLHLTAYGYDMLGGLLFNTISQQVPLRGCLCPTAKTANGTRQ